MLSFANHCHSRNKEGATTSSDYFVLTARFLCLDYSSIKKDELDRMYRAVADLAPRKMIDTSRTGGSNGTSASLDPGILRRFLHCPGSAPRRASSCKWIIEKNRLVVVYVSPYERERVAKSYSYPMPFRSGQIRWRTKTLATMHASGEKTMEVMEMFTMSKILSTVLFEQTNKMVVSFGWSGFWKSAGKNRRKIASAPPVLRRWLEDHSDRNLVAPEATGA